MLTTQITLTDKENKAIRTITQHTGKTQEEVLHEAVEQFIAQFKNPDRQVLLKQARGIWKDRDDLPDFKALRRELDRF
jgi:hypothetical protein